MMNHHSAMFFTILFISLSRLASCYSYDALSINYNGTIRGSYVFNHANMSSPCRDAYYFESLDNSYMHIGVNPPWDTNPFFFQLSHAGNDYSGGNSKAARNQPSPDFKEISLRQSTVIDPRSSLVEKDFCISLGGCTYDAIYNLNFNTAWYVCQSEGHACPQFTYDWYYVSAEMVNLSRASVSAISSGGAISNDDHAPFYSVVGDERTWVSNGTVDSLFNFQIPQNYSSKTKTCFTESTFEWNHAKHMTYNLNFTNTTSVSELTITSNTSTVTILFSGTRYEASDASAANWSNAHYAIELADPASHPAPHFTFTNGSEFHFPKSGSDGWDVTLGSFAASLRVDLATVVVGMVFGYLVVVVLG